MSHQGQRGGRRLRAVRRLTVNGWIFLVELLEVAGYGAKGPEGDLIVSKRLKDDLFESVKQRERRSKVNREYTMEEEKKVHVNLAARLQRLRPGHPQESVGIATLELVA